MREAQTLRDRDVGLFSHSNSVPVPSTTNVSAVDSDARSESDDGSDIGGEAIDFLAESEDAPASSPTHSAPASNAPKSAFEGSFVAVEQEWQQLETLKLVFERAQLQASQQLRFLRALQPEQFAPGDYIVRQGGVGDKFYIITEGEVIVTKAVDASEAAAAAGGPLALIESDGASNEASQAFASSPQQLSPKSVEVIVTHLYEGHFFGEASLVTEQPRNANVRVPLRAENGGAALPVRCMTISKEAFTPFLTEDDRFRTMISELVRKNDETARRRGEMLASFGSAGNMPEAARNEVKVARVSKRTRTADGKLVLNGHVFISKLGQGSYGTVWLAVTPEADNRKSAIKVVSRALLRKKRFGQSQPRGKDSSDPELPDGDNEALREAAVMKRLQHRNVVSLFEVIDDLDGDKFYMVQEFMELGPVMTEREYNQPLPPAVARAYFRDVLCGLEYLHFQGIVHRDIKPSNILVAADGTCKLADFGTAAISRDGTDLLDEVRGTPAFQPPEVFDTIDDSTNRYHGFLADVWALGATLHTMVVGVPPYMAANEVELIERLRSPEQFRLSVSVQLDPHLKHLLLRCLQKDPARRISLQAIMSHEWVTEEGSRPLPTVAKAYRRLNLQQTTTVVEQAAGIGDAGTGEGECQPVLLERSSALVPGAFSDHSGAGDDDASVDFESKRQLDLHNTRTFEQEQILPTKARFGPRAADARVRVSPRAGSLTAESYSLAPQQLAQSTNPQSQPSAAPDRSEAAKLEHMRALRMRQHQLLAGHTTLTERERDVLLDQKRMAFHKDRATASVEELFLDSSGFIQEARAQGGGDSSSASKLLGPKRASSRPILGLSSTAGSTALSTVHEPDDKTDIASEDGDAPSRPRALGRKQDFLMVTANVDAAEGGGALVRKVIFRAKAADGSLSITGGGRGSKPLTRKGSLGKRNEHFEAAIEAEDVLDAADEESGKTIGLNNSDREDGDTASESSASSTYEEATTLDDMSHTAGRPVSAGGGAKLQVGLEQLLSDLSAPLGTLAGARTQSLTEPQSGGGDPDLMPFSQEQELEWLNQRQRGLFSSYPGLPVSPADVARLLDERDQRDAKNSAPVAKGLLAHHKNAGKKVAALAAVHKDEESDKSSGNSDDEDDAAPINEGDEDSSLSFATLKFSRRNKSAAKSDETAETPFDDANCEGQPGWDACLEGPRFVSCPIGQSERLGLVFGSAESIGKRATMEDRVVCVPSLNSTLVRTAPVMGAVPPSPAALAVTPEYAFFAVYDGHNGSATSEALSQALHFRISAGLGLIKASDADPDPTLHLSGDANSLGTVEAGVIVDASLELDLELQREVRPGEPISGSTAIVALLRESRGAFGHFLTVANVGDSRCVLSSAGGRAVELSSDHKCSRPDERRRIEAAGGQVIRDRLHGVLAVSRAFGDAEHKRLRGVEMWGREFSADPLSAEPEIVTRSLERGANGAGDEFIILACDGVWDVLSSQQAVNFVRRRLLVHRDVRRAAQELVNKALALASIDNVSVIVVAFV